MSKITADAERVGGISDFSTEEEGVILAELEEGLIRSDRGAVMPANAEVPSVRKARVNSAAVRLILKVLIATDHDGAQSTVCGLWDIRTFLNERINGSNFPRQLVCRDLLSSRVIID